MGIVVAFDPGPYTGVAIFRDGRQTGVTTVSCKRQRIDADVYFHLRNYLTGAWERPQGEWTSPTIVIERFTTHSPAVGSVWSGRITAMLCGYLEGTALLHGYSVVWQGPAERKPYEDIAKTMRHNTPHEVSATAHGLAYLTRSGLVVSHVS